MSRIVNHMGQFLSSRKLGLVLLAVLLFLCVAGSLVPQEGVEISRTIRQWQAAHPRFAFLGATHIFSTWYFSAVVACIFVNITFSTGRLVRRAKRTSEEGAAALNAEAVSRMKYNTTVSAIVSAGDLRHALPFIRISTNAEGTVFHGERFRFARWSMILFHCSLLLIIGGAFLNRALFSRSVYSLVERDHFITGMDRPAYAEQGFLTTNETRSIKVTLSAVRDVYAEAGYQPSLASEILIESPSGMNKVLITRADPVSVGDLMIYQSPEYGYAPVFTKLSPDGSAVTGTVRMTKPERDANAASTIFHGSGVIPRSGLRLECSCTMLPLSGGIPERITLTVSSADGLLARGKLSPGSEVRIGRDIIRLEGILFWTDLIVSRQPWTFLLYIGFFSAFLGLASFVLFNPCSVYGIIDAERKTTTIAVHCRRFHISEDLVLKRLVSRLSNAGRGSYEAAGSTC